MKINRNSWHFKFLFSESWWNLEPLKYQTLCSYNWAIISRVAVMLLLMVIVLVVSTALGLILVGMPLLWIYNCITSGFYMSFDAIGLVADAILGGRVLDLLAAGDDQSEHPDLCAKRGPQGRHDPRQRARVLGCQDVARLQGKALHPAGVR